MVSLFGEDIWFVVSCNICNIMCEVWASTICNNTLSLQKGLGHKGICRCIMKSVASHQTVTQNFNWSIFKILFLASFAFVSSRPEGLFEPLSMYSTIYHSCMAMISMGIDFISRSRRVHGLINKGWCEWEAANID